MDRMFNFFARKQRVYCCPKVLGMRLSWFFQRIQPADIPQHPEVIKDVSMRCGDRSILNRDNLIVAIVEIRKIIAFVPGPYLHFFIRIIQIRVPALLRKDRIHTVRHDRCHGHALVGIVFCKLDHPVFIGLCGRTVITAKQDHQDLCILEIVKAVEFSADIRQLEIRGCRTDI